MAAPFTAISDAIANAMAPETDLAGFRRQPAFIPPGSYRRFLATLAKIIASWGYEVIIPHRDINGWGQRKLIPSELADKCLSAVRNADYFVGLLENSFGSHVEMGVAIGAGVPIVLLRTDDGQLSFFGDAVAQTHSVKVIRAKSRRDLLAIARKSDIVAGSY
jgi:hypothetical protein